jgi:hypothetical protein
MMRHLVRLAALVVAIALSPALSGFVATQTADSCCAAPEPDASGCPGEDGRDCDCPLGCAPCCAGSALRAIAPATVGDLEVAARGGKAPLPLAMSPPPSGVARDILKIPKLAC